MRFIEEMGLMAVPLNPPPLVKDLVSSGFVFSKTDQIRRLSVIRNSPLQGLAGWQRLLPAIVRKLGGLLRSFRQSRVGSLRIPDLVNKALVKARSTLHPLDSLLRRVLQRLRLDLWIHWQT